MTNQMLAKLNMKITWNRHPVAVRNAPTMLNLEIKKLFCHFSKELLSCDLRLESLLFLGKATPSRWIEYDEKRKFSLVEDQFCSRFFTCISIKPKVQNSPMITANFSLRRVHTRRIFVAEWSKERDEGARLVLQSVTKLNGLMRDDGRGRENGVECESLPPFFAKLWTARRSPAAGEWNCKTIQRGHEQRKH